MSAVVVGAPDVVVAGVEVGIVAPDVVGVVAATDVAVESGVAAVGDVVVVSDETPCPITGGGAFAIVGSLVVAGTAAGAVWLA